MVRFKQRYLLATLTFPAALPNTLADTSGASESSHAVRALAAAADTSNGNSAGGVSEAGLVHLLRDSLAVNFGDAGAGAVGGSFSIKYLSPHTQLVIFRVAREHVKTLWQALTFLRKIGGREVVVRVLHVSGTIRKTQHAAIRYDRELLLASAGRGALKTDKNVETLMQESAEAINALEA